MELSELMRKQITMLEAFRDVAVMAADLQDERNEVQRALDSLPRFSDPEKERGFRDALRAFSEMISGVVATVDEQSVTQLSTSDAVGITQS